MKRLWKAVYSVESVGKPAGYYRRLREAALVSNGTRKKRKEKLHREAS